MAPKSRKSKPNQPHRGGRRATGQRAANPAAEQAADQQPPDGLEQLFSLLRSGAANVAGVTFQVAVTAWLLAVGRAGSIAGLEVASVVPEGFEDVDCELTSGLTLLVQTKERGVGARPIGLSEVANIIAHAAPALNRGTDRFAILTNGRFGGSLPTTGFASTIEQSLGPPGPPDTNSQSLVEALGSALSERGLEATAAKSLTARTHLVVVDGDLGQQTNVLLELGLSLHPAVAALVRADLLSDLGEVASRQREQTLASALRRSVSDLDVAATRILQAVDVRTLEEAIAAGVCEPADYVAQPSVDVAGFHAGVDVIPAHVSAGFDVVRPEETTAILEGLSDRRDVVIVGPSGSGKSALLWRSAHLVRQGVRIVRVLRVATPEEAELLVRHVRRQMPDETSRVLVAADDLGRDRMAAWPDARRRLVEIKGVLLLGAVRREDLTPKISASAVVVDPRLTDSAAKFIYDAIDASGVPTALAAEEAIAGADGLLMEFIALTTTGHRLREVLATQVAALHGPEQSLQRDALRIVCAAHLLGSAVAADSLPAVLGIAADTVGEAMSRLAGEHLVVAEGRFWHGLHDLRTEVLFDLVHESPPPTMATSYARALRVLPVAAQGPGARRAAVRLGRALAKATPHLGPTQRLKVISDALAPIADALRDSA